MQKSPSTPYYIPTIPMHAIHSTGSLTDRSISPLPTRFQVTNYPITPENIAPPQTEIKISKSYRSTSTTPNVKTYSHNTLIIENSDPVSLRLQGLNQKKHQLYDELNQISNDSKVLNIKLQDYSKSSKKQGISTSFCNESLLTELMKIKEILSKCDFHSLNYNNNSIIEGSNDFHCIETYIMNITNNLKFFEEKLFLLWNETERLGKEVIEWQNTCAHQETVYNIRINDLRQKLQQQNMMLTQTQHTPRLVNVKSTLTINDMEYKNRIKELEKRVNELEIGVLTIKDEKEGLSKEILEKNERIKQNQKDSNEKILLITTQLEQLMKIIEEKNETIENFSKIHNFNENNSSGLLFSDKKFNVPVDKNDKIPYISQNFNPFQITTNTNYKSENHENYENTLNFQKPQNTYNPSNYTQNTQNSQYYVQKPQNYSNTPIPQDEQRSERAKQGGIHEKLEENPVYICLLKENKELDLSIRDKNKEISENNKILLDIRKERDALMEKLKLLEKELNTIREELLRSQERKFSSDGEIKHIIEKSQELTKKNLEFQRNLENLLNEQKNYKNIIEELRKEAEEWKGISQRQENELREQVEAGKDKKNAYEKEINKISSQNEEISRKCKKFEEIISKLQMDEKGNKTIIGALKKELDEMKEKCSNLEKDYTEEIEEIRVTFDEEKMTEMTDRDLRHKAELEVRDTKIMQQENQIEELKANILKLNSENKDLEEDLYKMKDELSHFKDDIEKIEDISRKKEEELENEIEAYKKELQEFQEKEIKLNSERKSMDLMINQIKDELDAKHKENENVYELIQKRNLEIENLKKEVKDLREENFEVKTHKKQKMLEISSKDEEIEKLNKEIQETNAICDDYKTRMNVMNDELGDKNQELQNKIEELDIVKKEYEKIIKEFNTNVGSPPNRRSVSTTSKKSITRSSIIKELNSSGIMRKSIKEEEESEKNQE